MLSKWHFTPFFIHGKNVGSKYQQTCLAFCQHLEEEIPSICTEANKFFLMQVLTTDVQCTGDPRPSHIQPQGSRITRFTGSKQWWQHLTGSLQSRRLNYSEQRCDTTNNKGALVTKENQGEEYIIGENRKTQKETFPGKKLWTNTMRKK